jgi:outer membrane lipoprotein-sorting protein
MFVIYLVKKYNMKKTLYLFLFASFCALTPSCNQDAPLTKYFNEIQSMPSYSCDFSLVTTNVEGVQTQTQRGSFARNGNYYKISFINNDSKMFDGKDRDIYSDGTYIWDVKWQKGMVEISNENISTPHFSIASLFMGSIANDGQINNGATESVFVANTPDTYGIKEIVFKSFDSKGMIKELYYVDALTGNKTTVIVDKWNYDSISDSSIKFNPENNTSLDVYDLR